MIEIEALKINQIEEVKRIIFAVCYEISQLSEEEIRKIDGMSDIEDARSHYFDNKGTFLVILDDGRVVGCGAIRRLTDDCCELKRMWLLKDYRKRGLGTKIAQMLLDFARETGYNKVRLDMFDERQQTQALQFYERLGFYSISRYNDSFCTLFMEKIL